MGKLYICIYWCILYTLYCVYICVCFARRILYSAVLNLSTGCFAVYAKRIRLRALWSRCNSIHMSPPIPPAQTFPPTPVATPSPSPLNSSSNWHETLPPKISSDDVTAMKQLFEKNYPGEVLDPHSTPSIRLWSLVHQQKVNKMIKYIPIQLRLSEHQYSAMIETN